MESVKPHEKTRRVMVGDVAIGGGAPCVVQSMLNLPLSDVEGNIAQIDTPYLTEGSSGLTYVVERFQGWPHAATITLTRGERSRLADFATEVL